MNFRPLILLLSIALSYTKVFGAPPTIILGDGDSLPIAVASSQNGDVIEIRSNGEFNGNLSWKDKFITIQAGNGFSPVVRGSVIGIQGNSQTGGAFRGLTFTGGLSVVATSTTFAEYVIEETTFNGRVSINGTGSFQVHVAARDSSFIGGVQLFGTGGFSLNATFERNVFDNLLAMAPNSRAVHVISFIENDFLIRPTTAGGTTASTFRDLKFHRNRFREGVEFVVGDFNRFVVDTSDNVFGSVAPSPLTSDPGILLRSFFNSGTAAVVDASFANNTVVGFDTGAEVRGFEAQSLPPQLNVDFANMLLSNTDDILNVNPADISFSLIADGTFDGQNGNSSGIPLLGPAAQLLSGSPGIDRGNNSKASAIDFAGNVRILDGNGDGIPVVDVGAYEFVIPEPSSLAVTALGLLGVGWRRRKRA